MKFSPYLKFKVQNSQVGSKLKFPVPAASAFSLRSRYLAIIKKKRKKTTPKRKEVSIAGKKDQPRKNIL